jgi:hypothetical protein
VKWFTMPGGISDWMIAVLPRLSLDRNAGRAAPSLLARNARLIPLRRIAGRTAAITM